MFLGSFPLALPAFSAAAPTGSPSNAIALSLTIVPQRLPADGKSYPAVVVSLHDKAGLPSLALNGTTVFLTSSENSVGTVEPTVVIPAGHGYVVANFTTTLTAGVTIITASATGISSTSAAIQTKTPSGFATALKVTPVPGSVLARPGGTGSLVIQLQDDTGLPAKAAFATNVTISSSNNAYVQPDNKSVIINPGNDLAIVDYTVGSTIGSAFVTASASGFNSGTSAVGIVGSPPFSLKVSVEPNRIVTSGAGRVVIWLEDPSGNPARAPSPVTVAVTSSNQTVGSITKTTQTLVIPTGQTAIVANLTTTAVKGETVVTASAQGLLSGFDTVETFPAVGPAAALQLFAAPNPVLADNSAYKAILVSVINGTGFPDVVGSSSTVNLTSSNTGVGSVTESVSIPAGNEWATASFASTYLVGSTVLTASAQNLVSSQISEAAYGPIPASVLVVPAVKNLPADGQTYTGLAVVLEDINGNPALAPSDTVVQIASSRPDVISVNSPVVLKAGQTYAFVSVTTGLSPGAANITASSSGYAATSAVLKTVVPAPTKLAAYLGPSDTINSTIGPDALLTVQLQDINGFPAEARQTTHITVASSNTTLFKQTIDLTISPGSDYASAFLTTSSFGSSNLTASAAGLAASSAVLTVLQSPVSFKLLTPSLVTFVNTGVQVTVNASALGHGLKGAKVTWSAKGGSVTPSNSTTAATGFASTTFISQTAGIAKVTAIVTSPLSGPANLTEQVIVQPAPVAAKPPLLSTEEIYIIVIAVVVVVAVLAFWFLRRRRKRKAAAAGTLEETTQPYDDLEEVPVGAEVPVEGGEEGTGGEEMTTEGEGTDETTSETETGAPDESS